MINASQLTTKGIPVWAMLMRIPEPSTRCSSQAIARAQNQGDHKEDGRDEYEAKDEEPGQQSSDGEFPGDDPHVPHEVEGGLEADEQPSGAVEKDAEADQGKRRRARRVHEVGRDRAEHGGHIVADVVREHSDQLGRRGRRRAAEETPGNLEREEQERAHREESVVGDTGAQQWTIAPAVTPVEVPDEPDDRELVDAALGVGDGKEGTRALRHLGRCFALRFG